MTSYVRAPLNFAAHQKATVGDQKISFTNFDHLGWMKCDGRAVSRTTYALLFDVIGTTFGSGDGSTTFNIPDFRGCVPGMAGQPTFSPLANPLTYARGAYGGEQQHLLTINEMPAHKHGSVDVNGNTNGNGLTTITGQHNHGGSTGEGGNRIESENVSMTLPLSANVSGDGTHTHSIALDGNHQHEIGSTGGNQYHNNMQPTLFSGNMYIFSGRMYSGLGTYPYSAATDLA